MQEENGEESGEENGEENGGENGEDKLAQVSLVDVSVAERYVFSIGISKEWPVCALL